MSRESIQEKRKRIKIAAMSALAASIAIIGNADDAPIFDAPLVTTLRPNYAAGSYTATFTRATTAYVEDFEGLLKPVLSGEARFKGARRVQNYVTTPDLSDDAWSKENGGAGSTPPAITYGLTDPKEGTTACRVQLNRGAGNTNSDYSGVYFRVAFSTTTPATSRIAIKSNTGEPQTFTLKHSNSTDVLLTATDEWQTYSITANLSTHDLEILSWGKNASSDNELDLLVAFPQLENVTGQSDQAPGEYVNSGTLSAPYHGAGVDGVKWFTYENGNTVSSNVVTEATGPAISSANSKFAVIGSATSYLSAPSSAAYDFTAGIDIRAKVLASDLTATGNVASRQTANSTAGTSFLFGFNASGLRLISGDGSTLDSLASTANITTVASNRTWIYIRVVRTFSPNECKFYYSFDGVTWTQLGNTITSGASTAIQTVATSIFIGAQYNGGTPVNGIVGRAGYVQIYNVSGAKLLDCDPNDFSSGSTFTSSTTGETWTINGNARIFGGSGSSSIAAPWDEDGPHGYHAWKAHTNLCLRSQEQDVDGSGSPWTHANVTVTANQGVAPDGTTTADNINDGSSAGFHTTQQAFTKAASATTYTLSAHFKYVSSRYPALYLSDSGTGGYAGAKFDVLNGTIVYSNDRDGGAKFGVPTGTMTALPNGWYRCTLTVTTDAGTALVASVSTTNFATVGTSYTGANQNILMWGVQLEAASFASPYTPTTTAAVTVNADVLTYSLAGNIEGTVGAAAAEVFVPALGGNRIISTAGGVPMYLYNATGELALYDGTAERTSSLSVTAGALHKIAVRWGGSSAKMALNGSLSAALTFDGDLTALTSIGIGNAPSGLIAMCGTIRNVRIYGREPSDARLEQMTS